MMALEFFHVERIEKHLQELGKMRYKNKIVMHSFSAVDDEGDLVNQKPGTIDKKHYELKLNDFWSGRDKYVWLSKEVKIPDEWSKEDVVGVFDFGKTGEGNNSGFESLLYINNQTYQGVDSNHKEVFFDLEKLGNSFELNFRLWSGLEGGGEQQIQYHQIKEAFIACLDQGTDNLYYTGNMVIETIKILDDSNYYKHKLTNLMIKTMQAVDFTNIGSDSFYESVNCASVMLESGLDSFQEESNIHVYCVGHTHIDVAWLWRLKHTREKAARSFSTVNRLMERYDEYVFLQTQAQLYDYIKADFPEIYESIKKRVKQGKWEPSGAMWVEADCNLTSGESLVRQILYGKRFFKKEFDYESTYLWLPDVFGYSWALPQILKKSNIDTFITTKISWNEYNKMPCDTFNWRGIDGSEVLAHFITTPDDNWFYTYNGMINPKSIQGVWENYSNKDLNSDLLVSYGYGDGGGGVNREMLENRRRLDKIPGMPKVSTTNVTDYLERLHATIDDDDNNGYLHTWDSELYLEYHRGTYTSQAHNKKMNRLLEFKYRDAEILQVLSSIKNGNWHGYKTAELTEGWKIILRNQFHDIIPGSSIHEVYEDSREEYKIAEEIADDIIQSAYDNLLTDKNGCYVVFNNGSFVRDSLVTIPVNNDENISFEDESGQSLPVQLEDGNIKIYIEGLQPLGFKTIHAINKTLAVESTISKSDFGIESQHYALEWNDKGQLIKLWDKDLSREVLTGEGNVLEIYEDKPRRFDAWELESSLDLKKETITNFKGARIIANGCHYIKVRFEWTYNKTSIEQDLILYHNSKRIDFETRVDWQETQKLLKVAFPVDVRSTKARYDIQYGNVERATHKSNNWDFAKFEVVGHKWADLAERGFGVALMNNCKYGYDIHDNVMRLSLLKAAIEPDTSADKGLQTFTYSLFVHKEEWNNCELTHEAWDLNMPITAEEGHVEVSQLFELSQTDVVIDTIKKSEDENNIIIRFHEERGGKSDINIKLNFEAKGWYEVDLMENKIGEECHDISIERQLKPYEIVTYLILL